jgi:hypothetical protein
VKIVISADPNNDCLANDCEIIGFITQHLYTRARMSARTRSGGSL